MTRNRTKKSVLCEISEVGRLLEFFLELQLVPFQIGELLDGFRLKLDIALGPRLRQYEEYFQKSKDIQGNC